MGSAAGARKTAAARVGLAVNEYMDRLGAGLLHCWHCNVWHAVDDFGKDATRWSGHASACRRSVNAASKASYKPLPRPEPGRRFAAPRDGDRMQARGRVNYLVDAGLIPDPNDLPCADCGHKHAAGECRHEYDHHLGYAAEHHESVEAVCSSCHHARENKRRAA
jgi:hypothetical protein